MTLSLATFAGQLSTILEAENNPVGREKAAALVRDALADRPFVESLFDAASPERKVVYEHPALGFCILAHRYTGPKDSPPHDHGPSWAIYGQADGETAMTDWALVAPASASQPGKVRKVRDYKLTPGLAHVYNEGDLHAPSRAGPTRLIRLEGTNMDRVTRLKYEPLQE